MKLSALISLVAALVPTVAADAVQCTSTGNNGDLTHVSFLFQGYCEGDFGQCFLSAFQGANADIQNWKCVKSTDDPAWYQVDFDISLSNFAYVQVGMRQLTGDTLHCPVDQQ